LPPESIPLRTQQSEQNEVQRHPADRRELGAGELEDLGDQQRHQHRELEQPNGPGTIVAPQPEPTPGGERGRQQAARCYPQHREVRQQPPAVKPDPGRDGRRTDCLHHQYGDRDARREWMRRKPVEPFLQRLPAGIDRSGQLDLVRRAGCQ
jgi:hypothetical protein